VAAISGILAAVGAGNKSTGWWVALGVLVFVGAILQGIVTIVEPKRRTVAAGPGSVAIGGNSSAAVQTRVHGTVGGEAKLEGDTVALAPGAVSISGDSSGPVTTDVTDPEITEA
jgi:hypothetical protein